MTYDVWRLQDINLASLRLVKQVVRWFGAQDHSRWVFYIPRAARLVAARDVYVKIWNASYVRRDNVVQAIDAGFYDERTVPALRALIFDRGTCRGYVMERCRRTLGLDGDFYELIKRATAATGYFQACFGPHNTMRRDGRYSLIDLEDVYPLADLPNMPFYHCKFDWPDYARFVEGLALGVACEPASHHGSRPRAPGTPRSILTLPPAASTTLARAAHRWAATRWLALRHRTHLIERT
jgi:hypothetical protein